MKKFRLLLIVRNYFPNYLSLSDRSPFFLLFPSAPRVTMFFRGCIFTCSAVQAMTHSSDVRNQRDSFLMFYPTLVLITLVSGPWFLVICFTLSPSASSQNKKVPDKTKSEPRSWPTVAACLFNVQLCIAEKAAGFLHGEFHKGVDPNSCKPEDLRFVVKKWDCPTNTLAFLCAFDDVL